MAALPATEYAFPTLRYVATHSRNATIYQVDPLVCTRCGRKMQMIAFLTDQLSIRKILEPAPCRPAAGEGAGDRPAEGPAGALRADPA